MKLVQEHIIKSNHQDYKSLMNLCHLSKNLYNAGLYNIRQHFFNSKNDEDHKYLNYHSNWKKMCKENNVDFRALDSHISQDVLKQVDRNFKSFFVLLKKKKEGKYKEGVNIPRYLPKDGYNLLTVSQFSKKRLENEGCLSIPKTGINIYLGEQVKSLKVNQFRVIPLNGYVKIEVIYDFMEKPLKEDNNRYISIDLGINNLCSVSSNVVSPFIINGRPVKSINQFYNKELSHRKSRLEKINTKKTSNFIHKLNLKRRNKIKDYFHKTSSYIVNQAVDNQVNTIIIGKNLGWKQETDMGSKNNQNFVQIPFNDLIQMIDYKAHMQGICVIMQEESYTSKASFLDDDKIPVYKKKDQSENTETIENQEDKYVFSGRRIKRGLYKSSNGRLMNADINGSLNIMRKYTKASPDELLFQGVEGLVFNPRVVQL